MTPQRPLHETRPFAAPPIHGRPRTPPPPAPGELLDPSLRLTRLLGSGGECEVFAAWDSARSEAVAVKLARDEDLELARLRMDCERAPLRAVTHPNLVRALDARVSPERCYLVLEPLDPCSLAERVRQGPLAPTEAVRVIREVASALTALHAAGWAHRDVKAENVLFGFDGRAVLTDLGLACDRTLRGPSLRRSQGTPAYMAPELLGDAPMEFDALLAADQYALGVTAFLALAGALPYAAENVMAMLFAHAAAPVPAASSLRAELARFDVVLRRGLAKDPRDRFPSVAAFADALAGA